MSTETTNDYGFIVESSAPVAAPVVENKTEAVEETAETADEAGDESEASEEQEQDGGEEDSEETEESSEQDPPKKKNGYKKRIDKLVTRERQAIERAERAERALAEREQAAKGQSQQGEKPKAQSENQDVKPNKDDFESYDEYNEALIDWKAEQKFKAQEAKSKESEERAKAQSEVLRVQTEHTTRVEKYKKENPSYTSDVTEAIEDLGPDFQFSSGFSYLIQSSENGTQLFHEIAKMGADELRRFSSMDYGQMNRELGKLEARLSSSQSASKPKQEIKKTTAPRPLSTVKSQGAVAKKTPRDVADDFVEYERLRLAEIKGK